MLSPAVPCTHYQVSESAKQGIGISLLDWWNEYKLHKGLEIASLQNLANIQNPLNGITELMFCCDKMYRLLLTLIGRNAHFY